MRFTYFAGRYFAVEKSSESAEIKDIIGESISSAWKTDGTFHCDDTRYVQIYDLVEKAVEANMVSIHTDCPTIERFALLPSGSSLVQLLRSLNSPPHDRDLVVPALMPKGFGVHVLHSL